MPNLRKARRFVPVAALSTVLLALPAAFAQHVSVRAEAHRWIIESVGTASASPDVVHLMMKMEYEAAQAADATRRGEKQLAEFLTAVDSLKIPNLTYRVWNNVIMPSQAAQGASSGVVYSRNVVFTLRHPQPDADRSDVDRTIAQLEDLGARYNSHCVTCVGSG